jgi:hypothetical protein
MSLKEDSVASKIWYVAICQIRWDIFVSVRKPKKPQDNFNILDFRLDYFI